MVSNTLLSASNTIMTWVFVGLLVVLVVVLLVVPMFTNKKRAKQTMDLHNSLMPGDVIKTVGGVIGTIKEIRQVSPTDREMIIETGTGDNKTTMTFDIQALYQILERVARPETSDVFSSDKAESEAEHVETVAETAPEAEASVEEKDQVAEAKEETKTEEAKASDETVAAETAPEASEEQVAATETPAAAPKAKKAGASNSAGKKKTTAAKNSENN